MSDETILAFENVTLAVRLPYETGFDGVSFSLQCGDFISIRIEEGLAKNPFADLAEGIVDPDAGRVAFLGEDWRMMTPNRSAELRGKIGRVFEAQAWISNLDVDENITLVQRYHTARPEDEIVREAELLVRQFGLEDLPRVRPAVVRRSDLRRAEWVRAFIGEPRLIILENPTKDVYMKDLSGLVGAVKAVRGRGAAVIWMTDDKRVLSKVASESTHMFEWRGEGLVSWEEK
jgi:phospholipid/cholesterol/gamma-HCH transport system ATP-binding protein